MTVKSTTKVLCQRRCFSNNSRQGGSRVRPFLSHLDAATNLHRRETHPLEQPGGSSGNNMQGTAPVRRSNTLLNQKGLKPTKSSVVASSATETFRVERALRKQRATSSIDNNSTAMEQNKKENDQGKSASDANPEASSSTLSWFTSLWRG